MCRNIRTLFNFEPPATEEEIRASAVQFVRKLSGFTAPSRANAAAFQRAVDEYEGPVRHLADVLEAGVPRAVALLERQIADLEAYLAVKPKSS